MPQLFPMNWIFLSILLFTTIYLELNLIYFFPFIFKKNIFLKKNNLSKNWKW
nr:ATP synthase F0 subunit 8 [Argas persicus]